jgi:hypothetical protein
MREGAPSPSRKSVAISWSNYAANNTLNEELHRGAEVRRD